MTGHCFRRVCTLLQREGEQNYSANARERLKYYKILWLYSRQLG